MTGLKFSRAAEGGPRIPTRDRELIRAWRTEGAVLSGPSELIFPTAPAASVSQRRFGEVLMRRLLIAVSLAAFAAGLTGCVTLMPVSSHVERGLDFARYRTYDWTPADALPLTDERLGQNPFFVDDVHGAIDTEMNRRGLARATAERADLFVHYHAAVNERLEVATHPGAGFRDCFGDDCRPDVATYEAGTLVIDLVDASTHRLVWRGWAEHRLEDMLDDPVEVKRRVDTAVRRIFATLPPAVTATSRPAALEDLR